MSTGTLIKVYEREVSLYIEIPIFLIKSNTGLSLKIYSALHMY